MAKKLTNAQKLKIQNLLFDQQLEVDAIAADTDLTTSQVESYVEELKGQLNKVAEAQEKAKPTSAKVLELMGRKTKDGQPVAVVATSSASELQDERKKNRGANADEVRNRLEKHIYRPRG